MAHQNLFFHLYQHSLNLKLSSDRLVIIVKGFLKLPNMHVRAWQLPWNHCTWSFTCAKILANMKYAGWYQKTFIRWHTFYLVIFLTIFPKLALIYIEWKIGNLVKTKFEVSFKKIHIIYFYLSFFAFLPYSLCIIKCVILVFQLSESF